MVLVTCHGMIRWSEIDRKHDEDMADHKPDGTETARSGFDSGP
jgi:hypothetical protein